MTSPPAPPTADDRDAELAQARGQLAAAQARIAALESQGTDVSSSGV